MSYLQSLDKFPEHLLGPREDPKTVLEWAQSIERRGNLLFAMREHFRYDLHKAISATWTNFPRPFSIISKVSRPFHVPSTSPGVEETWVWVIKHFFDKSPFLDFSNNCKEKCLESDMFLARPDVLSKGIALKNCQWLQRMCVLMRKISRGGRIHRVVPNSIPSVKNEWASSPTRPESKQLALALKAFWVVPCGLLCGERKPNKVKRHRKTVSFRPSWEHGLLVSTKQR